MKKSLMPVLAGTLILTMTACGQKAPTKIDTIKANGELRIAVTDVHSLNCEYDANTNTYTGVEPDFASFIAEDLGVSPTFVQMNLDDAKNALNDGSVDIAIGNINNENGYMTEFGVSSSYGNGYLYCVTLRGNFINTFGGLKGLNVCEYSRISKSAKDCYANLENITITDSEDLNQVKTKLIDGTIDAYMCYEYQANELIKSSELQAQNILGAPIDRLVVINNINDTDVTYEVNLALQKYAQKKAEEKALEEAEAEADESNDESEGE